MSRILTGLIIYIGSACLCHGQSASGEIFEETYELKASGHRDLTLYLKYPDSGKEGLKGVIAFVTPGSAGPEDLAAGGGNYGYLVEFANEHSLATVVFGQPSSEGWNRTVSSDQLTGSEAASQDRNLDSLSREFSKVIDRFSRNFGLPDKDWFLYGVCGGAQYAHRIALRIPEKFKAVHVHDGGSYDVPSDQGGSVFWLVTSDSDEPAYIAAQRFYRSSREKGYGIILRGYSARNAPANYEETYKWGELRGRRNLSVKFFEYALSHDKWGSEGENFIADYVNELVVPEKEGGWIPASQAILLPGKELASAWKEEF